MSYKNILFNSFGISDSGGITVLEKAINECLEDEEYILYIYCDKNSNIFNLINKFQDNQNINFIIIENKGIINRLIFENIKFRSIIKKLNIDLIYNFSGSAQFFIKTPSLVKIQNLMFYSKKLDQTYIKNRKIKLWLKQILIKRFIFLFMLRKTKNIEIQSEHVTKSLSDFLNISEKKFFLKNDFSIEENDFKEIKNYDFKKKIIFLYIVGPHFEVLHKNISDFINTMVQMKKQNFDFEIKITLEEEQLNNSLFWNKELNNVTTFLGYIKNKDILNNLFTDNTILISTSIVETIGLHVIEATQNGIISIVPNEDYSKYVYGNNILTYNLEDKNSLRDNLKTLIHENNIKDLRKRIQNNQDYLISNESKKNKKIYEIFNKILNKGKNNVQE